MLVCGVRSRQKKKKVSLSEKFKDLLKKRKKQYIISSQFFFAMYFKVFLLLLETQKQIKDKNGRLKKIDIQK